MTQKQIIQNALSNVELSSLMSESDYVCALYDVNEKCEIMKEQFIDHQHDLLQYDIFYEAAKINFKYKPKNKQEKEIINVYKFDHTHVRNAQQAFQNAFDGFFRNHLSDDYKMDEICQYIIDSKEFERGVKELETQFDCKIDYKSRGGQSTSTIKADNLHVSLSKSKGFQLNGIELDIAYNAKDDVETNKKLGNFKFAGQIVASSFLHEIFHNIVGALNFDGKKLCNTIGDEYDGFVNITKMDKLEAKCDECIGSICNKLHINMHKDQMNKASKLLFNSLKIFALGDETKLQQYIYKIDCALLSPKQLNEFADYTIELCEDIEDKVNIQIEDQNKGINNAYDKLDKLEKETQNQIENFENIKKNGSAHLIKRKLPKNLFIALILATIVNVIAPKIHNGFTLIEAIVIFGGTLVSTALFTIMVSIAIVKNAEKVIASLMKAKDIIKNAKSTLDRAMVQPMEEHFCDLFAAMYNLPVIFDMDMVSLNAYRKKLGSKKAEKVANAMKNMYGNDEHPSEFERNRSAYTIAGDLLKHHKKDLSKEEIAYLKYIRKNFKGIDKIKIKRDKKDRSRMDYEKDMNKHLNRIVKHLEEAGVTITESFDIDDYMNLLYMEYAMPNNTFYEDD